MSGSCFLKMVACFLLICVLTGYTLTAEARGLIVFVLAVVIACLGFFAGEYY